MGIQKKLYLPVKSTGHSGGGSTTDLADAIDPSAERKAAEAAQRVAHLGTFEAVARGYVFPSVRNAPRPMGENTLNVSLRRLGYDKETMTAHEFRSLANSLLNEQQWNKGAIERPLAHGERDKVRTAYNHADYLPERRRMMQAWAVRNQWLSARR